jgi:uncharacterized protein YdaU (DUF1376 family)
MSAPRIFTVPWHLGDWCAHTAMLTPLEYAFYHRALMECYMRGGRLSDADMAMVKRWACSDRTITERSSDDYQAIIERYFEKDAEGYWHNRRADEVLAEIAEKSQKARKATEARDKKHRAVTECTSDDHQTMIERSSDDHQTITENASDDDLTINHKPITNNTPKGVCVGAGKPRTATRKNAPLDFYGLPGDLSADWVRSRGSKKLTQTAINGVKREAEKAGVTFEQAVRMMLENGWQGFKASWDSVKDRAAELPFEDKTPEEVRAYEEQVAQAYGAPATPVDGEDMLGAMKGTFAGEFADDRAA